MLDEVHLVNFRLHKDTTVKFSKFNIFIGKNNTGKSSILHALAALRLNAISGGDERTLASWGRNEKVKMPLFDLGEYDSLVRHGERNLTIGVSGSLQAPAVSALVGKPTRANIRISWSFRDNILIEHQGELRIEDVMTQSVKWRGSSWQRGPQESVSPKEIRIGNVRYQIGTRWSVRDPVSGGWSVEGEVPASADHDISLAGNEIYNMIREFMSIVVPTHSLRGLERSSFPQETAPGGILSAELADRTSGIASQLLANSDLEIELANLTERLLGFRIHAESPQAGWARIDVKTESPKHRLLFEGLGAVQLPYLLVPYLTSKPDSIVFVEEPEAHLHPALQSDLVDLYLDLQSTVPRQVVMITHSEHILFAALNAVAQGRLSAADLAVWHFESRGNEASATKMEVTSQGDIEGGLPGFFEAHVKSLKAFMSASGSR